MKSASCVCIALPCYTCRVGKMFSLVALALVIACVAWAWVTLRRHSARKRLEEERAAAFMAEAASAAKKTRAASDNS